MALRLAPQALSLYNNKMKARFLGLSFLACAVAQAQTVDQFETKYVSQIAPQVVLNFKSKSQIQNFEKLMDVVFANYRQAQILFATGRREDEQAALELLRTSQNLLDAAAAAGQLDTGAKKASSARANAAAKSAANFMEELSTKLFKPAIEGRGVTSSIVQNAQPSMTRASTNHEVAATPANAAPGAAKSAPAAAKPATEALAAAKPKAAASGKKSIFERMPQSEFINKSTGEKVSAVFGDMASVEQPSEFYDRLIRETILTNDPNARISPDQLRRLHFPFFGLALTPQMITSDKTYSALVAGIFEKQGSRPQELVVYYTSGGVEHKKSVMIAPEALMGLMMKNLNGSVAKNF